MGKKIIKFACVVEKCVFKSDNFKIYGAEIDTIKYPYVKLNKYDNVTLLGNLHDLGMGVEYLVKAIESKGNYGFQYKVINIKRDKPVSSMSIRTFLLEILTRNQVDVLLKVYPDIVDRVMNDRLDDIDLSLTKGIKEYTFNVIKKKIFENFVLAELVEEFQGMIDFSALKKLYEKYPSVQKIKTEIQREPYKCLCSLSRIGFKTADSMLLAFEKESKKLQAEGKKAMILFDFDLKTSAKRGRAAILYLLSENEKEGNTKIHVKELRIKYEELVPSCIQHFVKIIKESEGIYYCKDSKYVSKKSTYETEKYIADKIKACVDIQEKNKKQEKHRNVWDFNLDKYKTDEDTSLTDEQIKVLEHLNKNQISILKGSAGTGKTFTTNSIIKMLEDNKKTYKLMSPTGRAAKVLAGYTKRPASTVHRGLGFKPPDVWDYNENCILPYDVIIIDEFSMADVFMAEKLLKAIDFNNTKLLIIGDGAQIPSVGAGNILFDLTQSNLVPTTTLETVFRFGEGGNLTVATMVRNGKSFIDNDCNEMKVFGNNKDYIYIPIVQEKMLANVKELYRRLLNKGKSVEDILILSSQNIGDYGSAAINQAIQKIANKNYYNKQGFKVGKSEFYIDDIVMQIKNNYKAKVFSDLNSPSLFDTNFDEHAGQVFISNGDIGKIIKVTKDFIVVKFDDFAIKYTKEDCLHLKLAYCISIHKSQGGSYDTVILLTPKAHSFMLNSNLLYVGQTRATKKVFHIGDSATVNRTIKKKANFKRDTFLFSYLTKIREVPTSSSGGSISQDMLL